MTLRQKLVLRVVAALTAVLLVTGMAMNMVVRVDLQRRLEAALRDKAALLATEVEQTADGIRHDFAELEPVFRKDALMRDHVVLADAAGHVIYRSPDLAVLPDPLPSPGPELTRSMRTTLPNKRHLQWVFLGFHPEREQSDGPEVRDETDEEDESLTLLVLGVGRQTRFVDRTLMRIQLVWLGGLLFILLLVAAAVQALARASLAPVEVLASGIAALDPDDPGPLLGTEGVPPDFHPIAERLNELLARLAAAFQREKEFSADLSHELRTPLAGMRTTLEVARSRGRTAAEYETVLDECLDMARGLQGLTEAMLTLKRVESGSAAPDSSPQDLGPLVTGAADSLHPKALRRDMTFDLNVPPETLVKTDPALLELAVRNVLDNAVSHGAAGSTVRVEVGTASGAAYLAVTSSGCSLTQEQAEALRARFRRGDPSRDVSAGHSGLGLAMVDGIAAVLGFTVRIAVDPPDLYRIRFDFPKN